ncbi:MAG: pilus assembly protein PilP [Deltaproteobacteria bacterium]|nr:pilus assembly protein PilP [Deltaproteobacteria bacterium]MCB9788450.1 pilus assembly protein PilP [Deltaproteobacteria bacterium]
MRRLVVLLAISGLLVTAPLVTSCGGSEEKLMEKPQRPKRPSRPGSSSSGDKDEIVTLKFENPKWDLIQPYFAKFLEQKHTAPKDLFAPRVAKFIPRPAVETREEVEETIAKVEDEPPRGPLEQYALKDYRLMIIMSGTAVPKAVVVDPKSQAYVIQRDTRIGSKGGIVESITQYMVVVKEPNEENATKITIKPPYLDLATHAGFEDEEAPPEEEFAVPPSRPVTDLP